MNHHIAVIKKEPKKFFAGRYTASVMLEQGEKLLLVQEAVGKIRGKWSLPSGHIDADETPFEAALREVREETGYRIKLTGLFGVYFIPAGKKQHGHVNYTFVARPVGKPVKKITKEILSTKWFSREDLRLFPKSELRNAQVLERLNAWLKGHKTVPISYVKRMAR